MKTKLAIFAITAILFGFGTLWTIDNGAQFAGFSIHGNTNQTASVKIGMMESLSIWLMSYIKKVDLDQNHGELVKVTLDNENQTNSYSAILKFADANKISIIIGGDVMLDRNIRALGEKNGYDSLFSAITPLFNSVDIVAINLEGPITSSSSRTSLSDGSLTESFSFTFDPKTVSALAKAHINVVSLANNHTDNFGMEGLNETRYLLSETGIQWFGNPWNISPVDTTVSINGSNVAFVGYNAFQKGFPNIVARIKELSKQGNFVIVMPHWGEEYAAKPTEKMRGQARELVVAGANAIMGSHSHVIGENEWIGAVPVYYSLGNLLFDQYFSPETMRGELVELRLIVKNGQTHFDSLKVIEISNASRKGIEMINN